MTMFQPQSTILNDWSDFWFYEIGANIIPANTKEKNTFESWTNWKDQPIPQQLHESRKKNDLYNKGIALITGKLWRGGYEGKYLVAIDLDNKKAIEEFVGLGFEELKQITLVEQTSNPDKAHIYFIVEREIPNKTSDKIDISKSEKIEVNEIPALEVKSNSKGIMFCASSPHKNGSNYRIIGTLKPQVFDAKDVEDRIKAICDKYNIPYDYEDNNNSNYSNQISIEELWNSETIILEGHNRHLELLRIMESLLQTNRRMPLDMIKQMAQFWNQSHCKPPLDDHEFEKQLKCALKFVSSRNTVIKDISNNMGVDNGDNNKNFNGDTSSHEESKNRSSADILVELGLKNSTLFIDEFSVPHALLKINNDYYEVLSIDSRKFEHYLSKLYYDNHDRKTANAESIKNASRTLGAKAFYEGQTIPLHLRVAWSNPENKESIYYDLSDKRRRCIKITKGGNSGWKIAENQIEVLFKRYGHQTAQFEPLQDYDSKILDKFVDSLNIKNENHKLLIKIWIVSLLIPDITHPMLLPYGEKGSAKSTLQKKIKALIDPSSLDLLSIYNDKTQFIQQLSHNYLCFYDNVRREAGWLSDEVCRAVTGGAFSKRKNYSDDDDISYKYKRIISFSGINVIFTQEDALDRSLKVELERIREEDNIPDTKIEEDLKQQIPELLGYIFDIVAKALEIKDSVKLKRLPRMADFALWGEAISRALGYKPLEFIDAYFENIGQQNFEIVESNSFALAISKFMDYEKQSWISSPKVFVNNLRAFADNNDIDSSKFPKTPQSISRQLNKIKSNLREGLGIEVIVERITSGKGNTKLKNTTIIKIRKVSPLSPLPPLNQNYEENQGKNSGGIISTNSNTSTETKIPPLEKKEIRAQIPSDKGASGDSGDSGGILQKLKPCHYCNYQGKSEDELLSHSVNRHPGKPARPDPSLLELMQKSKDRDEEEEEKEVKG